MTTRPNIAISALDHIAQGVVMFDNEKKLIVWNDRYKQILQFPDAFLKVGLSNYEMALFLAKRGDFGLGDPEKLTQKRLSILWSNTKGVAEITVQGIRIYEVMFQPSEGDGLAITYTDITDRKHVETRLRENEKRFRDFASSTSDWFWETDAEHRFTYLSDRFLQITGGRAGTAYGKTRMEIAANPDNKCWEGHIACLKDQKPFRDFYYEYAFVDGKAQWLSANGRPIYNAYGKFQGYRGTGREVTEQINIEQRAKRTDKELRKNEERLKIQVIELQDKEERLEEQANNIVIYAENLSEAHNELQQLNDQKNKFFSIIAHDLRGPFTILLGLSKLLSSGIEKYDTATIADSATSLHEAAQRVFGLLENLLDWSRLQMGRMEAELHPVNLRELIDKNLALFKPIAKEKAVILESSEKCPLEILADANMLDTVIRNLINNAIKFSNSGDLISVNGMTKGDLVIIEVKDTGVGMAQEKVDLLFNLGQKTSTTGTGGELGTGLGLHLCKELTEKQGGHISIKSMEGKGSTFSISLQGVSE